MAIQSRATPTPFTAWKTTRTILRPPVAEAEDSGHIDTQSALAQPPRMTAAGSKATVRRPDGSPASPVQAAGGPPSRTTRAKDSAARIKTTDSGRTTSRVPVTAGVGAATPEGTQAGEVGPPGGAEIGPEPNHQHELGEKKQRPRPICVRLDVAADRPATSRMARRQVGRPGR